MELGGLGTKPTVFWSGLTHPNWWSKYVFTPGAYTG